MHKKVLETLALPLELPCGQKLKNRIVKSAMSDSLGDGRGNPTQAQIRLYERWAAGGAAAMIIGEVQGASRFAEKPGNLVLREDSELLLFEELARRGSANGALLWLQLGHAGAMAYPPISTPKGPSKVEMPGLCCEALTLGEIRQLPAEFAQTALLAKRLGFSGVQIHAAHGFLLSQFLSPLFNKRIDGYGGSLDGRMRLLLEVIDEVRKAVGSQFVVSVKLNATDLLEGGIEELEALETIAALDKTDVDLIDVSGGTYFPGAKSASDKVVPCPYFVDFAKRAQAVTDKPLMVTGGFKSLEHAVDAITSGATEVVGLARSMVLDPELPNQWLLDNSNDPAFPKFASPPEGAITAWYTMRLADIGNNRETDSEPDLQKSLKAYNTRDEARVGEWNARFGPTKNG